MLVPTKIYECLAIQFNNDGTTIKTLTTLSIHATSQEAVLREIEYAKKRFSNTDHYRFFVKELSVLEYIDGECN